MQITISDLRNMTARQIAIWAAQEEDNIIPQQDNNNAEQQFSLENKEFKKVQFDINVPDIDMSICPNIMAQV